jgi:hypothetical protein
MHLHGTRFSRLALLVVCSCALALASACGDDDERERGPCRPGTSEGCGENQTCMEDSEGTPVCVCIPGTIGSCEGDQVCEEVQGGLPVCFAPVEIHGRVFDAMSGDGIEGATVVALDPNGGARSTVAVTEADGSYVLPVAIPRREDGTPVGEAMQASVTLRVAAAGFQVFPTAPRTAIPIDLTDASPTAADGSVAAPDGASDENAEPVSAWVVQNAATDVSLLPLPGDTSSLGIIEGSVDLGGSGQRDAGADGDGPGGVLVVATQNGTAVSTAVTDSEGNFTLFNVPPGSTVLDGYRAGLNAQEQTVSASSGTLEDVSLSADLQSLATVSGSVNIVNAPGGSETTVILVVESTFQQNVARGEAPAGLRAVDVSSSFTIDDVPPGRYVVLAAFENDDLVRDPDVTIGGTTIQHITVPENGGTVQLDESFKVTEALAVRSPGAEGLEVISQAEPVFTWADDSSEDGYELRVYDAFGELLLEDVNVPRVTGSDTVSYTWQDAQLQEGMIYQFRVLSYHDPSGNETQRSYISATEDLRGVFQYGTASQGG